jgi:hypothetical protein
VGLAACASVRGYPPLGGALPTDALPVRMAGQWLLIVVLLGGVWRGRAWARWVACVLCGLFTVGVGLRLAGAVAVRTGETLAFTDYATVTSLGIAAAMLVVSTQVLGFTSAVAAFFARRSGTSPPSVMTLTR